MQKSVFISYKNDGTGNNLAARLFSTLDQMGYDVYFNSNEQRAGSFPDRLRAAVSGCRDFLLVVSPGCLDQLRRHDDIDWIREELLEAQRGKKNIIPVLTEGASMPRDPAEMPDDLQFLPKLEALILPEQYSHSPLERLVKQLQSRPEKEDIYRLLSGSNPQYDAHEDYLDTCKKAEAGAAEAMYELAFMSFYGISDKNGSSQRDEETASYWFRKLADGDSPFRADALRMLGHMYYAGIVPREEQSYEKCLEIHREIAEEAPDVINHIAFMKSIGSGCDFDFSEAERCYMQAAAQGDVLAVMGLGDFYSGYGMFQKAAAQYKRIYGHSALASYKLGMLYKKGVHREPPVPDYFRAAFYFQHAISSGNCGNEPFLELGKCYFNPTGDFPKDFVRAQELFLRAADNGSAEACYMAGYMYQNGHVTRSDEKAVQYYRKAVEGGYVTAAVNLATLYQQEECKNYHQAYKYAEIAANAGSAEGAFILGNLLWIGRGCMADANKAYRQYQYAVSHGCRQAGFMLEKIKQQMK